jgi:hypothetical protein
MAGERRQQVLGGDFMPQPPTIPVTRINDSWIKIPAGSLSGVTVGSVYRLYQPQHPNPQSLPSLTITQVKPFASYGKPEGIFNTGDLVAEESHAYQFTPIKVSLEADFPNDRPLLTAIKAALQPKTDGTKRFSAYSLTDDPSKAELRLHLLRPKRQNGEPIRRSKNDPLPKSFPNQPPELWVMTPEQRLLYDNLYMSFQNLSRGIELLQNNLNKLASIRELKALQSHRRRRLPVTLQSYLLSPDDSCSTQADCLELPDGLGWHRKTGPYTLQQIETRTLNEGDILTFSLHNQSRRRAYYCYIFNISPDGAIYSIFPQPEDMMVYARVNAGEMLDLIEETGLKAEMVGEETIKFIISRYPIDVNLLEQEAFEQRGGQFNLSEMLLFTHTVYGKRGRVSLRNDEWATGLAAFEVR